MAEDLPRRQLPLLADCILLVKKERFSSFGRAQSMNCSPRIRCKTFAWRHRPSQRVFSSCERGVIFMGLKRSPTAIGSTASIQSQHRRASNCRHEACSRPCHRPIPFPRTGKNRGAARLSDQEAICRFGCDSILCRNAIGRFPKNEVRKKTCVLGFL